ncbi:MAG: HAMP domain-containing histidine kinase [Prevotella sp.]|nr:HAMP domain-containing histidine kinase [Prevotella sp.]
MMNFITRNLRHTLVVLLTIASTGVAFADKTVEDLTGEDREMYDKFRHLFKSDLQDDFYRFAEEYERDLHKKGYMMLYYKLLGNKGFYALRHNEVYRAIEFAQRLDNEVRTDGAKEYFYLATGLYGDIYSSTHDNLRAETYFLQALDEVDDRDVKFTMRTYMSLAELLSLKDSQRALQWVDKAIAKAQEEKNVDYLSLSMAMKGYLFFLMGDAPQFYHIYDQYLGLRSMDEPEFNYRYDNLIEVAKRAFDSDYEGALEKIQEGNLQVDSSLVVIRVIAMQGDVTKGFEVMKRRYVEMDSVYSIIQDANFNQLAAETSLMRSREEAAANRKLSKQLVNWLIVMAAVFFFVYIMGRRRLVRKIWARSKELKLALARAEESDRMKTAFIQSMSHEIRTPLNAVAGFSQLLCSADYDLTDAEKKDMQQRISSNVSLIISIVNEVLELSESESESHNREVEKREVKCNEFCRSVIDSMRGKGRSNVDLRFTTNVGDDFAIYSNGYRLRSALSHLVDNAQKFTDVGHIDVKVERKGDKVLFSVTDTGVGIAPEDRERIFEDFAKLDDFKEGIGLGLPISRRLITSLGGTLELDPDYTEGCRFVITLSCDD